MNIGSRLMLAGTAVGLLSGSLWVVLIPHLIWQYLLLMGATSTFGTALFVVTDPDTPELKERREYEEKERIRLEKIVEERQKKWAEEERIKRQSKPTEDLLESIKKVIDPTISKSLKNIYKVIKHINSYAIENDLCDKLIVWNTVYINNVTKLINEYNEVYAIDYPTQSIKNKIIEFEDVVIPMISSKVDRQYDDLLAGRVSSFDIDLTLIKEISEQ